MDRLFKTRDHDVSAGDDPKTAGFYWNSPIYETSTIKWTSTVSNRLLFEGGYSSNIERYNNLYEPGVRKPYGSPEWYAGALHRDSILGTRSNARTFEYGSYPDRHNAQAAVSYVRGGHSLKFGFQDSWGPYNQTAWANADLYQEYLNGPATVTLLATPARWKDRLNANIAMYGQGSPLLMACDGSISASKCQGNPHRVGASPVFRRLAIFTCRFGGHSRRARPLCMTCSATEKPPSASVLTGSKRPLPPQMLGSIIRRTWPRSRLAPPGRT